ncbi:MAG TPA: gamma-glutamyltransferase [Anaerolineales bacterium]|nr:gamma-glutamyltransferase [Anaerolineales bacterium]
MSVRSQYRQEKSEVVAENAMVAAECVEAAEAGLEIFEKGGNAVDAAVASSFASCVCEPAMASLGGGGAALIYLAEPGTICSVEFEGRLSMSATEDMFVDDLLPLGVNPHPSFGWRGTKNNVGWMGYRSLGVPGQVAGLCQILERFGTMSLEQVIAPAIRFCEEGYEVNKYYALMIGSHMNLLQQNPPIDKLLLPGGFPPIPVSQYDDPTIVVQKELAESLRKIAQVGAAAFYQGDIAKAIIADTQPHGSIVSLQDYADYQPKSYEDGLVGSYRGHKVVCMPEVFGGTQVLQTLNLLEGFDLSSMGHNSLQYLHLIAECFRRVWVDRFRYIGDPEFEAVPIEGLVSKEYAAEMRQQLSLERAPDDVKPGNPWRYQGDGQVPAAVGKPPGPRGEGRNTTHLCTMDRRGNMVSLVQTLGGGFGAYAMSGSTGIILRNYTNLFNPEPGTSNSIGPWKRPTSHDSLTLVFKDGEPLITIGAPGGRRVITSVVQVLVNIIDFGMGMQEAIAAPRIHIEGSDPKVPEGRMVKEMFVDSRIDRETVKGLESLGHEIRLKLDGDFALPLGIMRDPSTGKLHGGVTVPVPATALGL